MQTRTPPIGRARRVHMVWSEHTSVSESIRSVFTRPDRAVVMIPCDARRRYFSSRSEKQKSLFLVEKVFLRKKPFFFFLFRRNRSDARELPWLCCNLHPFSYPPGCRVFKRPSVNAENVKGRSYLYDFWLTFCHQYYFVISIIRQIYFPGCR